MGFMRMAGENIQSLQIINPKLQLEKLQLITLSTDFVQEKPSLQRIVVIFALEETVLLLRLACLSLEDI